jgi:type IV secretory pathway VirB2 component (pilin)
MRLAQTQSNIFNRLYENRETSDAIVESGLGSRTPETVTASILTWFLGILALIAVVLIIYGGFMWMTSAGNEEKVDKAKKLLIAATIGLGIILGAAGITNYVLANLVTATGGSGAQSEIDPTEL